MRVLLAEPFSKGHTTVVLRYCQKILAANGLEVVTAGGYTPSIVADANALLAHLQKQAKLEQCDLIHLLTVDYVLKALVKPSLPFFRRSDIPVVANLYNYNNLLSPLRSWPMRSLVWRGAPFKFFVSSSRLGTASRKSWQRAITHFIPDPYDVDEFPVMDRCEARRRLGLPSSPGAKVFLVFGTLDPRKGFDRILDAFAELSQRRDWHLLCAGVVDSKGLGVARMNLLESLRSGGRCTLFNGFVGEETVSPLFHSADFVVTAYPKWYEISSGNLTRACAAGRPSVCADHGEVGEFVSNNRCGIAFNVESNSALPKALTRALDLEVKEYEAMALAALEGAKGRDLESYGAAIAAGYRRTLEEYQ